MQRPPRARARSVTMIVPGDNTDDKVPSYRAQLQRMLDRVTQGRVQIIGSENGAHGTDFVLSTASLEEPDQANIRREFTAMGALAAHWVVAEQTRDLPPTLGAAGSGRAPGGPPAFALEAQRTLVVLRKPLSPLVTTGWRLGVHYALHAAALGLVLALMLHFWHVRSGTA